MSVSFKDESNNLQEKTLPCAGFHSHQVQWVGLFEFIRSVLPNLGDINYEDLSSQYLPLAFFLFHSRHIEVPGVANSLTVFKFLTHQRHTARLHNTRTQETAQRDGLQPSLIN